MSWMYKLKYKIRNQHWIYRLYAKLGFIFLKNRFKHLRCFLLFIGFPRSGTSILGSIIDAHPESVISHELNVLKLVRDGYSVKEIFYLIHRNSELQRTRKRSSAGYTGEIPGGTHGGGKKIRLLGDKKAGKSLKLLHKNPQLISKLKRELSIPIKFIHVIRNPYDAIATHARGGNHRKYEAGTAGVQRTIELWKDKIEVVTELADNKDWDIYHLRLEDLISKPVQELHKLFNWLELELTPDLETAIQSHLFKEIKQTRNEVKWEKTQLERIALLIQSSEYFRAYTFE